MRVWGGMSRRLVAIAAVLGGALPAGLLVTSCATSNAERAGPAPVGEQPTPMVIAPRVVEAGIGRWLADGAEVERKIAKSHFQGWEIRRLYSGDPCYATVDLRPLDVVIRVNGMPIEKPEQAFDVLSSLRAAQELVVDFLRDGQPQKLTLQIADE